MLNEMWCFVAEVATFWVPPSYASDEGFEQDSSVFGNRLINFCQKKRLKSAMITDDSLDNFFSCAWVSF